jgi:putative GTP pyrophosphokinase
MALVTNSQANRAAREFRRILARVREAQAAGDPRRARDILTASYVCIEVIERYRAMHEYPLRKVTMGVRVMTQTALRPHRSEPPRPTQRFKRMDRILFKLLRHPNMALSTMQDIGGCRVVFERLDDLRRVERHISRSARWRGCRTEDHVSEPKADGYRGVHIITQRDDRWIEVQLRTQSQHEWASAVEDAESVTGFVVKDGGGPDDLRLYFKLAADRLAVQDEGRAADPKLEEEFAQVRSEILRYYTTEPTRDGD